MPVTLATSFRFSDTFHWTTFVAKDWSIRVGRSGDLYLATVTGMGARPSSTMRRSKVGET